MWVYELSSHLCWLCTVGGAYWWLVVCPWYTSSHLCLLCTVGGAYGWLVVCPVLCSVRSSCIKRCASPFIQVHQIADLCDMQVVYCCKTRGLGGELGNAVLTKHEILETCRVRLDGWRYHGSNRCVQRS